MYYPKLHKLKWLNQSRFILTFRILQNIQFLVRLNFGNSHVFNLCSPRILHNTTTPNFTNQALANSVNNFHPLNTLNEKLLILIFVSKVLIFHCKGTT